jgi:hypothetical protein
MMNTMAMSLQATAKSKINTPEFKKRKTLPSAKLQYRESTRKVKMHYPLQNTLQKGYQND